MSSIRDLGPKGPLQVVKPGRVQRASMRSWLARLVVVEKDIKAGRRAIGTPGWAKGGGR